jgi:8-oxo-dGTP pyrophosphatase MutT (NUDIX family)
MKTIKILNPENATDEEIAKFKTREAARAIVFDQEGKIGVLYVANEHYHKLSGGGIKKGESILEGLKRECREELGCEIEVYGEVGQVIEYRKMFSLLQTSYVYLARVVGDKGAPNFTENELEDGFIIIWVTLDEAIELLASDQALGDEGKLYIVPRELALLEEAKNILNK